MREVINNVCKTKIQHTLEKSEKRSAESRFVACRQHRDTRSSSSLESFSEPLQHAQPIEGPESQFECDVEMQGAHANSDSDSDSEDADLDDRPSLDLHSGPMNFMSNTMQWKAFLKFLVNITQSSQELLEHCLERENVNLEMKSGMQYFYFGCKEQLCRYLNMYPGDVVSQLDCLDIFLNIDGLPPFKSSSLFHCLSSCSLFWCLKAYRSSFFDRCSTRP